MIFHQILINQDVFDIKSISFFVSTISTPARKALITKKFTKADVLYFLYAIDKKVFL